MGLLCSVGADPCWYLLPTAHRREGTLLLAPSTGHCILGWGAASDTLAYKLSRHHYANKEHWSCTWPSVHWYDTVVPGASRIPVKTAPSFLLVPLAVSGKAQLGTSHTGSSLFPAFPCLSTARVPAFSPCRPLSPPATKCPHVWWGVTGPAQALSGLSQEHPASSNSTKVNSQIALPTGC